jgi:hypothetical protein
MMGSVEPENQYQMMMSRRIDTAKQEEDKGLTSRVLVLDYARRREAAHEA